MSESTGIQALDATNADQGGATSDEREEFSGLSPSALRIEISPDQVGLWRLRKALALDDARHAVKYGRKDIAAQYVRGARFCHREIMRIRYWKRMGRLPPQQFALNAAAPPPIVSPHEERDPSGLAPKEKRLAILLSAGKTIEVCAEELGIAPQSVQNYKYVAAKKLGIKASELGAYAVERGWAA